MSKKSLISQLQHREVRLFLYGNGSVRRILTVVNPETVFGQALAFGAMEIFLWGNHMVGVWDAWLIHSESLGERSST